MQGGAPSVPPGAGTASSSPTRWWIRLIALLVLALCVMVFSLVRMDAFASWRGAFSADLSGRHVIGMSFFRHGETRADGSEDVSDSNLGASLSSPSSFLASTTTTTTTTASPTTTTTPAPTNPPTPPAQPVVRQPHRSNPMRAWGGGCGRPADRHISFPLQEVARRHALMKAEAEKILPPEKDPCRTGKEKCVFSISAYGSDTRFWDGAINNILVTQVVYPGWIVRIYHDDSISEPILARVRAVKGVELVVEREIKGGGVAGMFWRFLVADDKSVDRYVVRDADSVSSWREKAAVNAWIVEGKKFHIMRDHPCHVVAILGGMWGAVKNAVPMALRPLFLEPSFHGPYLSADKGPDQTFLSTYLYDAFFDSVTCHDGFYCAMFQADCGPFPIQNLLPFNFVGRDRVWTNDVNVTEAQALAMGNPVVSGGAWTCEPACRPPAHQDWETC